MIKHIVYQRWEMERYPEFCKECPAFHTHPYRCHNEFGFEGKCMLGYMAGHDMRDFSGTSRFSECKIENNPNVTLMKKDN